MKFTQILARAGRSRLRRRHRGSEVIELALLFLPLLWLTFGAIDFGFYFYIQHNVQSAAREGARAGVVPGATNANVTDAVDKIMTNAGFNKGTYAYTVTVAGNVNTMLPGGDVDVTVKLDYTPLGIPPARVQANKVIGKAVMRKEG